MAKLNFNSNQSDFAINFPTVTQTVKPNKTSFEMMKVEEIKLDPKGEFQKIFPLDETLIIQLTEVMQNKGYDNSQPLQICEILSEKESGWFLIDGHNRLQALIKSSLTQVPVYRHTFATRAEAKVYVMEDIQLHRRNLTQQQKVTLIESLDELKSPGRKSSNSDSDNEKEYLGKSSTKIAEQVGVSTSYVEQVRNVKNNGDEDVIEDMKSGKITVGAANKKTNEKKNSSKKVKDDDISDSLSDNSGNPASLNMNHSDGKERPDYKLSPEQDGERTQERKNAYEMGKKEGFEKGYSDGAYDVYEKIFELLESGLTITEVKNHNIFEDFSYSEISKKIGE